VCFKRIRIFVLLLIRYSLNRNAKETAYTQGLVKIEERALAGLHGIGKVNTLLQISDWYESQNYKVEQLQKAYDYAQQEICND
jgi:hypothetical protein